MISPQGISDGALMQQSFAGLPLGGSRGAMSPFPALAPVAGRPVQSLAVDGPGALAHALQVGFDQILVEGDDILSLIVMY